MGLGTFLSEGGPPISKLGKWRGRTTHHLMGDSSFQSWIDGVVTLPLALLADIASDELVTAIFGKHHRACHFATIYHLCPDGIIANIESSADSRVTLFVQMVVADSDLDASSSRRCTLSSRPACIASKGMVIPQCSVIDTIGCNRNLYFTDVICTSKCIRIFSYAC